MYQNSQGEWISGYSGQGSLHKPALKVYPITSNPAVGITIADHLKEVKMSGRCMLWSRSASDTPCDLYVAFDELTSNGVNDSNGVPIPFNKIQLTAGNVLDLRPLQWNTFTIIVNPAVSLATSATYGTIAVGDAFYQTGNGGTVAAPIYVLPGLHKTYVAQDWNGNRAIGTGWSTPIGNAPPFTYLWTNQSLSTNVGGAANYKVLYKNIGSNILYITSNPNLTGNIAQGTVAFQVAQTFPIQSGESFTFDEAGQGVSNLIWYAFSPDANAAIAAISTIYGV